MFNNYATKERRKEISYVVVAAAAVFFLSMLHF